MLLVRNLCCFDEDCMPYFVYNLVPSSRRTVLLTYNLLFTYNNNNDNNNNTVTVLHQQMAVHYFILSCYSHGVSHEYSLDMIPVMNIH